MLPHIVLIINLFLFTTQSQSRIVINEVMANPRGITGTGCPEDRNEFVELYNISAESVNVRGWRVSDFDATDNIIAWTDSTLLIRYPNVIINESIIPPYRFALILDPEYTSANPVGGEIQPYNFPNGLLILTVGNTTIGDGLATNDPLLLYSLDGDSSTFGTPFNLLDSFPLQDYGNTNDGLSWERISPWAEDCRQNWIRSLDTSGSTPGRDNSILAYYDLSLLNIYNAPAIPLENGIDTISVVIGNVGYQTAYCWDITVFDDINRNGNEDSGEWLFNTFGMPLPVHAETTISFVWNPVSAGEHLIWAIINYQDDINLNNNRLSKTISTLSSTERFKLVKNVFSPDYDGIDDSLSIQYNFDEPNGRLMILIYNLNGQLIRTLIDKKIYNKSGIVTWDGKNDDRKQAAIGIYIIYLEYKTSKSTITEKTSAVLVKKLN